MNSEKVEITNVEPPANRPLTLNELDPMLGQYGVMAVVIRDNEASDRTLTHQVVPSYIYVGEFRMIVFHHSNGSWGRKVIDNSDFKKALEIRDKLAEKVPETVCVEFDNEPRDVSTAFTRWAAKDRTDKKVLLGRAAKNMIGGEDDE